MIRPGWHKNVAVAALGDISNGDTRLYFRQRCRGLYALVSIMHAYLSFSYRDVAINAYFLEHLVREGIPIRADQKSDTWCVSKLERYLFETNGFISVIPKRVTDKDPANYSEYIGQELDLARRARVPRLLLVDRQVYERHELKFPEDAVFFNSAAPEEDGATHQAAISAFGKSMLAAVSPLKEIRRKDVATIIADNGPAMRDVPIALGELLRREQFSVIQLTPGRQSRALDDVRLLELLWRSELCVFVLGERISDAHLALAMAHAHCIPSVRLQYDKNAIDCAPTLQGVIRWNSPERMLIEFRKQLTSFRKGFVEPLREAGASVAPEKVARDLGTTKWEATKDNLWNVTEAPTLLKHVLTSDSLVQDEVNRVKRELKTVFQNARGRDATMRVCRALYDGFKRHRFVYETEPQTGTAQGIQKIRPPSLIEQSHAATCIDLACLFAALLEAAGLLSLIVVVRTPRFTHALAGYRASDEPPWPAPTIGVLRRALQMGDGVLFEATGAVEAEGQVAAERPDERREKLLDFLDAREIAERLINQDDVELVHLVDIRVLRR